MAVAITILTGCVSMNPSVVDPESYLGSRTNAPEVYRSVVPPVLLPVMDVRIDPMDRLFLVNFGDDPIYEGVELQTFPAADGGPPAARVLLWRADTVDVYDPPDRTFDEDVDRRGLEALLSPREVTLQRTDFDYRFGITEHGLDAALRIRDREGRLVEVEVVETRGEPVIGGLIAPVGATSASPDYLPLFFLDEFALVKRGGTRVRILVDGRERSPSKMTRLMSPALPDLTALRTGPRIEGRFVVNVNDVPGVVAGEYRVERDAERVGLVFQPLEAWQPPMVRGLSWVSSYRYEAEIDPGVTPARLVSRWERR